MKMTLVILLVSTVHVWGQSDSVALGKLKTASDNTSQVMTILSYLSDVYGPRLMGTPNYHKAVVWSESQLKSWGITRTQQQSFDKGHRGWEVVKFSMELVDPVYSAITAYPLAYTSSTNGEVTGEVIFLPDLETLYTMEGQAEVRTQL